MLTLCRLSTLLLRLLSRSVIRLILQFLQENNLHASLRALQEESQVGLTAVDDTDKLAHNITHGSQSL